MMEARRSRPELRLQSALTFEDVYMYVVTVHLTNLNFNELVLTVPNEGANLKHTCLRADAGTMIILEAFCGCAASF